MKTEAIGGPSRLFGLDRQRIQDYNTTSKSNEHITEMTVSQHYEALLKRSSDAFSALAGDGNALLGFTKSHNFIAEFEKLHAAIHDKPEADLLLFAIREYQFALYAAAGAKYRHATISLRLFLELSLATIYFSAHEIKLRQWYSNSGDINWYSLIDDDNGVYAKAFIRAFNPGLEGLGKQYAALAEKVYRECSEFVHGNQHTHTDTTLPISFDSTMLEAWNERASVVRLSIIFAFAGRYLRLLSTNARDNLESLMIDTLGDAPAIQDIYSK